MLKILAGVFFGCMPMSVGHAAPPDADARLALIRSWIKLDGPVGRPVFGGGLDKESPQKATPDEVWRVSRPWDRAGVISPPSALSADYRASVDRVLRWGETPQFKGTCAEPMLVPSAIFDRLRVAVVTARPNEVDRVKAAVRVALALRQRGNVMHGIMGVSVQIDAIRWARLNRLELWPELRVSPTAEDFLRGLAVDMLCAASMITPPPPGSDPKPAPLDLETFGRAALATVAPLQIEAPSFSRLRAILEKQRPKTALAASMNDMTKTTLHGYETMADKLAETLAFGPGAQP